MTFLPPVSPALAAYNAGALAVYSGAYDAALATWKAATSKAPSAVVAATWAATDAVSAYFASTPKVAA